MCFASSNRLYCNYIIRDQIRPQFKAFTKGFYEIIDFASIEDNTPQELELLISGAQELDVVDWRRNTLIGRDHKTDKRIGWFWAFVAELNTEQKAKLLQFVTGSSRIPLSGFKDLRPTKFKIHMLEDEGELLPMAHTCFNTVDIPRYKTRKILKSKFMIAIEESGGFNLS